MANHVRRQIRDAVEALLIAANTSAGSNVFQHRNLSLEDANCVAGADLAERAFLMGNTV